MSDSKKYYYIKLKENYFEQDNIKVLESMENGYIYSLIIIKLYLKSAKNEGRLMMTPTIPYDPNKVEILANVIGHDVAHVREAINLGIKLDLITIIEGKEIWLNDIQNFIGKSSTEADRIRNYRKTLTKDVQMYDKRTPEIELEIELEIEKELEIKRDKKNKRKKFVKPTVEEVRQYCNERENLIDPEEFVDFYESKGWRIGKSAMKDWKACVRTWERNRSNKPTSRYSTSSPFDKVANVGKKSETFEEGGAIF